MDRLDTRRHGGHLVPQPLPTRVGPRERDALGTLLMALACNLRACARPGLPGRTAVRPA